MSKPARQSAYASAPELIADGAPRGKVNPPKDAPASSPRSISTASSSAVGGRTAYILTWFPVPTETFVFNEVASLRRFGLTLRVFTLYGKGRRHLTQDMLAAADADVERLGFRGLFKMASALRYWYRREPALTLRLLRSALWRQGDSIEKALENFWAFLCAFALARRFEAEGIKHIHAPWACGPATAAWIASRLTRIPFTFTARAWDIYPPDGLIKQKSDAAVFVRSETEANVQHLSRYANAAARKFRVTYNGVPLKPGSVATVPMRPPYRLLAVGRFVRKKGFDQLLGAVKLLTDAKVDCRLTIAGDGPRRRHLQRLARRLMITDLVRFPGFVPHDDVDRLLLDSDIFVMPCVIAPSGDRDGIPTVIMEALLRRVPVVATDVSGIPELIQNDITGLLVAQRDPAALAAAIRRLAADRDFAIALAERGRAVVLDRFDPERNHRRVLDLYRSVTAPQ